MLNKILSVLPKQGEACSHPSSTLVMKGYHFMYCWFSIHLPPPLDFGADQDRKSLEGFQQTCGIVWFVALIESVSELKIAQRGMDQKESVVKFKHQSVKSTVRKGFPEWLWDRNGTLYVKAFLFLIFKIVATVLIFWTTFSFNPLNYNYRTLISAGNPLSNKKNPS